MYIIYYIYTLYILYHIYLYCIPWYSRTSVLGYTYLYQVSLEKLVDLSIPWYTCTGASMFARLHERM